MHISKEPIDAQDFPTVTLCGKVKKRKSLIPLPLACVRCVNQVIEIGNDMLGLKG